MFELSLIGSMLGFVGFAIFTLLQMGVQSDYKRGVTSELPVIVVRNTKYVIATLWLFFTINLFMFTEIEKTPTKLYILENSKGVKHSFIMNDSNTLRCIDNLGQITPDTKIGLSTYRHPWFGVSVTSNPTIIYEK